MKFDVMEMKQINEKCSCCKVDVWWVNLGTLSTDSPCQLDIFRHDGHTLSMDSTQVGVFKEADQVGLTGFLQSSNSSTLKTEICLEVLGNFSDQTLEGKLPDEQLSWLLVSTNFSQGNSARPVAMRFLHSTSWWGTLSSSLGCKLLSWSFTSSGLSCCLLCTRAIFENLWRAVSELESLFHGS